jgi:hypothetical protein
MYVTQSVLILGQRIKKINGKKVVMNGSVIVDRFHPVIAKKALMEGRGIALFYFFNLSTRRG